MTPEIEEYIDKYQEEIVRLFMKIRDVVFSIEDINVEAYGFDKHISKFEGFKFTPKGMLQIQVNQEVSFEALKTAFFDTYM